MVVCYRSSHPPFLYGLMAVDYQCLGFHLPWVARLSSFAYHKLDCHRGLETGHSPSFSNIWLMTMMRNTVGGFLFLSSGHYPSVAGNSYWSWLPVTCFTLPRFVHLQICLT